MLFVLAPNIRPVTILIAVDKKLPLPKKQAADSYLAANRVNSYNTSSSLQITAGIMAKIWQASTWQVPNFVVRCGKMVTARNFHAAIKTGKMKWVVIRELGN